MSFRFASIFLMGFLDHQVLAQDWSPSPVNMELTYEKSNGHFISVMIDSIDLISGDQLVWRKAMKQSLGDCDSISLFGKYSDSDFENSLPFYSLKVDSVYQIKHSYAENGIVQIPLDFEKFRLDSFNHVFILRHDSTDIDTVLTELDSMRHFSLLTRDSMETDLILVLSQRSGLIKFPAFKTLRFPYNSNSDVETYRLTGIQDTSFDIGLNMPTPITFMQRSIGDRFLYKTSYGPPAAAPYDPEDYCSGYIVQVVSKVDSQSGLSRAFDRKFYSDYKIEGEQKCMAGSLLQLSKSKGLFTGVNNLNFTHFNPYMLTFSSVEQEWDKFNIYAYESPEDCTESIIDGPTTFYHYQEPVGLILAETNWSWSYGGFRIQLVAAETERGNYGFWPDNLGSDWIFDNQFEIWPNPTQGLVHVSAGEPINLVIVSDQLGRTILTSKKKQVDLSNQPAGTYIISVVHDNQVRRSKILLLD